MSLSKIILSPSRWSLKGRLANPATRTTTLQKILGREHISNRQAIAILSSDAPEASKVAVVQKIREAHDFAAEACGLLGDLLLPGFFSLLAAQPESVVAQAQYLWGAHKQPAESFTRGRLTFEIERSPEFDLGGGKRVMASLYHAPARTNLDDPLFAHDGYYEHIYKAYGCRVYDRAFYF
jgi:hypothetical protein